jgi:hypothetical protein
MVVSSKRFTSKKPKQAGGSTKQFGSADTKKNSAQMGGSRKTKKHSEVMHEVMHEICVACHRSGRKEKVAINDIREESFKGKGSTMRKRLVGKCEHGHKWFRFIKST